LFRCSFDVAISCVRTGFSPSARRRLDGKTKRKPRIERERIERERIERERIERERIERERI
jgi:hypothetical protein